MPELPEVETVRRHLEARVPGRVVRSAWSSGLPLRRPLPRGFRAAFRGARFTGIRRVGKFLYLDWLSREGGERSLLAHLGMTGRFLACERAPRPRPPHVHAEWRFEDGSCLLFCDPRRFGLLDWAGRGERPANVGLDPTEERLTGRRLAALLAGRRAPIKSALLDQRRLAGLGNIYACEALFRARLAPTRPAGSLDAAETARLARAIRDALAEAVRSRGTTFSDFRDPDDRPGGYGTALRVYGREGRPCVRCGRPVARLTQAGRSTFHCPGCQGGATRRRRRP